MQGNFISILIIAVCVIAVVLGVRKMHKRTQGGCCEPSDGETVRRIRPRGRKKDYPYQADLRIDGMMCDNCAAKVDNTFNSEPGMMCATDLSSHTAHLYAERQFKRAELADILRKAGSYTLMDVSWKKPQAQ